MSYVDVTNIPEGAAYYIPQSSASCFAWIKFNEEGYMEIICPANGITEWELWIPVLFEDEELDIRAIPQQRYIPITMILQ